MVNLNSEIINNKLKFLEKISGVVELPGIIGILKNGSLLNIKNYENINTTEFLKTIPNEGVILKPIDGDGGEEIYKLKIQNNGFIINDKEFSLEEVVKFFKSLNNFFISEYVKQHKYSASLYSETVNTIRILTIINPKSKEPEIIAAAHRIGNKYSIPVDNCAKGGFTAYINIDTGKLGKAIRTYFKGNEPEWFEKHPDSGNIIENVQIPNWDQIKSKVLYIAEKFNELNYIGWDIVVLESGEITILEANQGADLKLHQVHKPLLLNDSFYKFCKFHKII